MKFTLHDDNVDIYNVVFEDDLLGRNKISERISRVVDVIEDPLVIALDGRWGTGKSFFLKRWVGAHTAQNSGKALTVYFDAFSRDYISDPLPALVSTLSHRTPAHELKKIDRLKRIAYKFVRPAARIGISAVTFGATEALSDLGDVLASAAGSEAKEVVDAFWAREAGRFEAMEDFKKALADLTVNKSDPEPTPVVIVVDELDRCRPDYALEVLEIVKHFFSVPHVHFILGVNLKALENSVKSRYGSNIDATAYLQKFISFSIKLPAHIDDHNRTLASLKYARHLGKEMSIPNYIVEEIETQLSYINVNTYVSMRDIGKIMSLVTLIPPDKKNGRIMSGWTTVLITMLISKVVNPDIFDRIVDGTVGEEQLRIFLGATEANTTEILPSGQANPYYVRKLHIINAAWTFILSDGRSKEVDGFDLGKLFTQFGDLHSPKSVPSKINDDWLSELTVS